MPAPNPKPKPKPKTEPKPGSLTRIMQVWDRIDEYNAASIGLILERNVGTVLVFRTGFFHSRMLLEAMPAGFNCQHECDPIAGFSSGVYFLTGITINHTAIL
jgi:hypothetical protein